MLPYLLNLLLEVLLHVFLSRLTGGGNVPPLPMQEEGSTMVMFYFCSQNLAQNIVNSCAGTTFKRITELDKTTYHSSNSYLDIRKSDIMPPSQAMEMGIYPFSAEINGEDINQMLPSSKIGSVPADHGLGPAPTSFPA